jgi:hypothetical protein
MNSQGIKYLIHSIKKLTTITPIIIKFYYINKVNPNSLSINFLLHDCTAILIRCCINKCKLTSSVPKSPFCTVALLLVSEEGFTLTLIFLSLESPGLHTKNLGRGNLSAIIAWASSRGAYSKFLKFSY